MTATAPPAALLKSVSRSFFLSLRVLPAAVRPAMTMGYLLCRAADTIADTDAVPSNERLATLKTFQAALNSFPMAGEEFKALAEKLREYGSYNKGAEGKLLEALPRCARAFETLPKTDQALVQEVAAGVIRGMEMDLTMLGDSPETIRALKRNADLESYLLLIGGEPGRFWSKLCLSHFPRLSIKNKGRWMEDGVQFGTGLQLVNILRDIPEDAARGRCYIPQDLLKDHRLELKDIVEKENKEVFLTLYHSLIDVALERLEHGVEYIFQIPKSYPRLRAAAWWPLALGLQTLSKLRYSTDILNPAKKVKISRGAVYKTMAGSAAVLLSDRLLKRTYNKYFMEARSRG